MTIQRWVPDRIMGVPVNVIRAYPPGSQPPGSPPIEPTSWIVVVTLANGRHRYYGFADAKIDSHLRMRVTLLPGQEHDEVVMAWPTPKD